MEAAAKTLQSISVKNLKNKGYINSYEDENTEETFFLTEDGKEMLKNLKSTDDEIKE